MLLCGRNQGGSTLPDELSSLALAKRQIYPDSLNYEYFAKSKADCLKCYTTLCSQYSDIRELNRSRHTKPNRGFNAIMFSRYRSEIIIVTSPLVPGHVGIQGNELADKLARNGSERRFIGPEPCIALAPCVVNMALSTYAKKKSAAEWDKLEGLRHSKKFLSATGACFPNKINRLSRRQARYAIAAITGHFGTGSMLLKIDDPTCRACNKDVVGVHGAFTLWMRRIG
ncbi:jg18482 [Pararge aegeria aegeria]|uniref:Jg18482 protein n=1 Tax=Pararge aegeria aegeria TaxID=348720 RepID=A0A8S4RN90_9NEOP|nr:jg18482 [Pararge aegeria aegeria]